MGPLLLAAWPPVWLGTTAVPAVWLGAASISAVRLGTTRTVSGLGRAWALPALVDQT